MIEISDTALAVAWLTPLALLTGLASTDAFREMFPPPRDLLSRLVLVRLHAMLARRQIALPAYLSRTSRRQMAAQIRSCATCPSRSRCDAVLQSTGSADFSFCPSARELSELTPTA